MRIGVADNKKPNFELYLKWLRQSDGTLEIVKLSYGVNSPQELDRCDGLLLTGGGDVDPKYYNRSDAAGQVRGVDPQRDDFEFRLIDRALKIEVPVLGICRGLQVTNVAFGGSLIPDLVSHGYENHRQEGDEELLHRIGIEPGSLLGSIIASDEATVNTAHHQAADRIGEGLRVAARSSDGVVEALEWAEEPKKPFLLLVQWHPERMKHHGNPASRNILGRFLSEIRKSKKSVEA